MRDENEMTEGLRDPEAIERIEGGETPEGLDAQPISADEVAPVDEAPPKRYAEDLSTKPRTSPVPPHFPQGEQRGFERPEGDLPPAVRSAERIKSDGPKEKSRARRARRP